jgi:hypothetical protein
MQVYITKNALTSGIASVEAEVVTDDLVRVPDGVGRFLYYGRKDWYESKREAVARAKAMRDVRVERLTHQLEKLKALTFREVN